MSAWPRACMIYSTAEFPPWTAFSFHNPSGAWNATCNIFIFYAFASFHWPLCGSGISIYRTCHFALITQATQCVHCGIDKCQCQMIVGQLQAGACCIARPTAGTINWSECILTSYHWYSPAQLSYSSDGSSDFGYEDVSGTPLTFTTRQMKQILIRSDGSELPETASGRQIKQCWWDELHRASRALRQMSQNTVIYKGSIDNLS